MAEDERPEGGQPDPESAPDPEPIDPPGAETAEQESAGGQDADAASAGGGRGLPLAAKIGIGVAAGIAVLYAIGVLWSAGGIPSNTVVAGVQIGGLSEEDATEKMAAEFADLSEAPIAVAARGAEGAIDPVEAEMSADYAATAEIASGPIFNPIRLIQHITGQNVEVAPVVVVNEQLLDQELARFATTSDDPAVEPVITMSVDQPTLEPGQSGEGIDPVASADLIVSSYLFTVGPLDLPVIELEPIASDEEAQRVLEEYAVPAVSGPVELTFDSSTDTLSEETIAEALSFLSAEGTLQPQLNVEVVRAGLPVLAETEDPGTDATWDVSSGKPVVVPSKQGLGVTDEDLTEGILAALPNTEPAERTVELAIVPTDAALTTEDAQALNITEKLSSFTQQFDYARYREVNVGQAAEYMNGKLLLPGDVYSMNETIMERTEANGYTSGTFISGGRFEEGLGGGVSIATTATWTAAFFAGLEAVEVNPHSLYISRYQPGLEATVAWGLLDLKFANNTGNGVLITTEAGGTFITVEMWGTSEYSDIYDVSSDRYNITSYSTRYDPSSECTSQGGVNGFTIDVWRVFEQGGQEVEREKFTTRYDPTTRYVCGSPPAPPSPPPAPSPTAAASPSPSG